MRKIVLVVHISLDGFVAGPNGELNGFPSGEENLQFVSELTRDADAALFGRISHELLESYWPTAKDLPEATLGQNDYSTWYAAADKIVISRKLKRENLNNTIVISDNIADEISELKRGVGKKILIFGSPSIARLLMRDQLIDSYWIFVNPVIFGQGIPLFKDGNDKMKLSLQDTKQFSNGEIALHYIKVD